MDTSIFVTLAIALCLALLSFLYLSNITSMLPRIYITNLKITKAQEISDEQEWRLGPEPDKPIFCDRNHFYYDICHLNRPTIINPMTATFFTTVPTNSTRLITEKIKPHPRTLSTPVHLVTELTLTTSQPNVSCTIAHLAPALIISLGGWTGNFWHDIVDRFIPLFITVETFYHDRDFFLGIFNYNDQWMERYLPLLSAYTRRQIINLDEETVVHCFPSVIVGLVSHGPTAVDPTLQLGPRSKTIRDFSTFFKSVYAPNQDMTSPLPWKSEGRPRLVIVNRYGPRSIVNIDQIQKEAEQIGFEVVIFVPSHRTMLHEAYRLINSSHALIGVHGAALSNILFLRPGSVFMQLVPPKCGWLGDFCFGKMATRLGLKYLIYDVGDDEGILEMDPRMKDWAATRVTHVDIWAAYRDQVLKLNIVRFKRYIKKVYKKAALYMEKEKAGVIK